MPAADDLASLADTLLDAEGSRGLVERLDEVLTTLEALPAALWLADANAHTLYQGATFGQARGAPDEPQPAPGAELPPGDLALYRRGELVGLLRVPPAAVGPGLVRLAAMLGPLIVHLHRFELAQRELGHAQELNTHLLAAGDLLRHVELDVLLVKVLETVLGALQAQVAAVITPDERRRPVARVTWGLREDHVAALRLADGFGVAEAVLEDGKVRNFTAADIAAGALLPLPGVRLTGLLALPLSSRGVVMGVVLLANPQGRFGVPEQRLAETVCSLAAIALDNAVLVKNMVEGERLRQELDLARGVQAGMFPGSDLTVGTLVLAGGARPCSETGGDYYTWLTCDGRVRTMISDVSGHGLGAALYTTMAHVLAQQQLRSGAGLEAAVKVLNDGLFHAHSGRFMTAALVDIDPATGAMNYTSAGHNPLLWINQGEVRWLDSSGMPIGVMDEGTWPEGGPLQLAPGDLLMLYTDGFTEAVDATSDAWGDDRFAATVLAAWRSGSNPAEISTLVHAAVDAWVGSSTHLDDLTMVVMHWAGPSTMPV